MAVLFLLIHIIICLLVYILMRLDILKSSRMAVVLAWLVPIWGLGCVLVLEIRSRGKQEIREEVGIEKLKINDEIHRSILMEEETGEDRIVPIEEALLINDSAIRRELMMEIMYSNPDNYVAQLQEARMNDDTEVVHYAVTALVELQKEYDLQFQEMEKKLSDVPDDEHILNDYIELVEKYLASGLLEGSAEKVQLSNYARLLEQKLEKDDKNLGLYCKKIEANLRVEEYESAYQDIQKVLDKWPSDESGYLFLIQYYSAVKSRKGIDSVLDMIARRNIYLSPKGRSTVEFWKV